MNYEDFRPKFRIDFEFWDDGVDIIFHSLVKKNYKSLCMVTEMTVEEFDELTMEDIIEEGRKSLFTQHEQKED